jgi:predicted NBD/HSP70 family sugar kinase
MKRSHFIGLDMRRPFTEVVVITATGHVRHRQRCPTTIPALAEVLAAVPRPCAVALEEGPRKEWPRKGVRNILILYRSQKLS